MKVKPKFEIFGLFLLIIISISCSTNNESDAFKKSTIYPELKPPFRIGVNQIKEKDSTFDIVLTKFKERLIQSIQIQNPILKFDYQNRWKICYKINSNKNFDIFVVEQKDSQDARSLMLITSQKEQPQNIISAVIVGLENYVENADKIESEDWSTVINADLSLKILKKYQSISASEKENLIDLSENSNIQKDMDEIEETYKINDDGLIVFVDKAVFIKPSTVKENLSYRAVIAFSKINEDNTDENGDDWMLSNVEIQNACINQNILFIQVYDNFDNVTISNESGEVLDTIDISFVTTKTQKGYVLVHSKMDPSFVDFTDKNTVLKAISAYFNLELLLDE